MIKEAYHGHEKMYFRSRKYFNAQRKFYCYLKQYQIAVISLMPAYNISRRFDICTYAIAPIFDGRLSEEAGAERSMK